MRSKPRLLHLCGWLLFLALIRAAMQQDVRWAWLLLAPVVGSIIREVLIRRRGQRHPPITAAVLVTYTWLRVFLRYRLGLGKRPTAEATQPKGFCPKCGYPINPGRCPECGTEVSREKLKRRPQGPFARHKAKLVVAATGIILILGGHLAYVHLDWHGILTTERLLLIQKHGIKKAERELEERYKAGKLSKKQKQRLLRQALTAELQAKTPYPSDTNLRCVLAIDLSMYYLKADYKPFLREYQVLVDGRVVPESEASIYPPSLNAYKRRRYLWVANLEPGERVVTVQGIVTFSDAENPEFIDALAVCSSVFSTSATIEVQDRPASEFVEAITSPELGEVIAKDLFVRYYLDHRYRDERSGRQYLPMIQISRRVTRTPLAGDVLVRVSGKGEFQKIGSCYLRRGGSTYLTLEGMPGLEEADAVDVRIEPSAQMAVFGALPRDGNRYYGGTIERLNVELPSSQKVEYP